MKRWVRLARLLATRFLPARDREFILGDLEERYRARRERDERSAARAYVWDALLSIGSGRWHAFVTFVAAKRGGRDSDERSRHPIRRGSEGAVLSDLLFALRMTIRSLRRQPALGFMIIVTLALGVGAMAGVFGLVNQLVLSPLPGVQDSENVAYLAFMREENPGDPGSISSPDFEVLRSSATLLDGVGAFGFVSHHASVDGARPVAISGSIIHGDYFEVLGVRAARGRLLTAEETGPDAEPRVAVISERLWRSLLGGAEDVVGRVLQVNGQNVTIVGVAGGDFAGAVRHRPVDMWLPWSSLIPLNGFTLERLLSRESIMYGDVVVRPAAGVRLETAEAQLGQLIRQLAEANPESAQNLRTLDPRLFRGLHTVPTERARTYRSLAILSGAGALILLIACANVANLLLFRGLSRRADWAVRRALGASRARVARHELLESLVLAGLGVGVGLGVGWLVGLLFRGERVVFRAEEFAGLALDQRVLLFAAATVGVTTLLFGVLPAFAAGRANLAHATRGAGRRETGRGGGLLRALSAVQIGLCLPLLVGALLLTRTVRNLYDLETGLAPEGVATLSINLSPLQYEPPQQEALHRALLTAIRASPAVEAAALDVYGPFSSSMGGTAGLVSQAADERIRVSTVFVTPGWFETLGVQPVSGRTFRESDWDAAAPTRVLITESLARRLFGRTDVVGQPLVAGFSGPQQAEIVGVVGPLKLTSPRLSPTDAVFFPYLDTPIPFVALLARTRGWNAGIAAEIRSVVEAVVPGVPVPDAALLTDRIDRRFAEQRIFARLLGLFSALGVLLSAVGFYGVIAASVRSRRREFGIRVALGARASRIGRIVVAQATSTLGVGLALGLGAAFAITRVIESRLFDVAPTDPASYAFAVALFTGLALIACLSPLRDAARVDPVDTLKE